MEHNVIFVTDHFYVEGFLLSRFGGTTEIFVGENGECFLLVTNEHILLGTIEECKNVFQAIKNNIDNVKKKNMFFLE